MKAWLSKVFGGQEEPTAPVEVNARSVPRNSRIARVAGDWKAGQELLDDFVVDRTLGEGGMGKVHLLHSKSSGSQFAVKRAKGLKEIDRRNFLAELQTWIDLPEHDNLVPCRFFRTVGGEVLIFAEYVEGGSLKEWIDSRNLYEGGPQAVLERMLDVAIQFAWGLHCVHELGLIHQDVKPGNVLMARDGRLAVQGVKPRLTDFGLARARAAAGERYVADSGRSILVSSGGGTPAYWSPEQAQGQPLTRRTDIWSWGVSVLEMFAGGVSWVLGQGAAEILEQYLQEGGYDDVIPTMPAGLVELLRNCFRQDPTERPDTSAKIVERLKAIYQESVGDGYGRPLATIKRALSLQGGIKERRDRSGGSWTDAQVWLENGLRAAGRNPVDAAVLASRRGVTWRGELVAELMIYEEAKRVYERLVREGRKELEIDLAKLCMDKAFVHSTAADTPGAMQAYDQAIAIGERLVNQEGRREMAHDLAQAYMMKGGVLRDVGDYRAAVALLDQAIAIRERLVNQEGRHELANDLAQAYLNKANAVADFGDYHASGLLLDQAITIRERLVQQEGRPEVTADLGRAYMNKALRVYSLGDYRAAVVLLDQAVAILERLVNQEGWRHLADDLAKAYTNKGAVVDALGDARTAATLHGQAIAVWEQLANEGGRPELANYLAFAYMNKATAVRKLGDNRCALVLCDQAITILERLVNQEGRRELVGDLACVKVNRGSALIGLGEKAKGLQEILQAQSVLEAEIARTGQADLRPYLTTIQQLLANG